MGLKRGVCSRSLELGALAFNRELTSSNCAAVKGFCKKFCDRHRFHSVPDLMTTFICGVPAAGILSKFGPGYCTGSFGRCMSACTSVPVDAMINSATFGVAHSITDVPFSAGHAMITDPSCPALGLFIAQNFWLERLQTVHTIG